jgi:Helix-turn-helix
MTHSLWAEVKMPRAMRAWTSGSESASISNDCGGQVSFRRKSWRTAPKIHQTYLSGVERGVRNPSIKVLERIARALGADIEDLRRRPRR